MWRQRLLAEVISMQLEVSILLASFSSTEVHCGRLLVVFSVLLVFGLCIIQSRSSGSINHAADAQAGGGFASAGGCSEKMVIESSSGECNGTPSSVFDSRSGRGGNFDAASAF